VWSTIRSLPVSGSAGRQRWNPAKKRGRVWVHQAYGSESSRRSGRMPVARNWSDDTWRNGSSSARCSALASVDLAELEAPLRRITRPGPRGDGLGSTSPACTKAARSYREACFLPGSPQSIVPSSRRCRHRLPRAALRRLRLLVRPDTIPRWHRDPITRRHTARSTPSGRAATDGARTMATAQRTT
jgi:hypothetical protein